MDTKDVQPLEFRELDQREPVLIDVMTGPTPQQIDQLITYYESAVRAAKAADECLGEAKQAVLALVRNWGYPVAGSESSREIQGALNRAVMTTGRTVTLNETPIFELHNLLSEHGRDELFDRLFLPRTRHELVAGADETIKTMSLPAKLTQKVLNLYGMCFVVKDKAPSLKVDLLKKEPKLPRSRAKKTAVGA